MPNIRPGQKRYQLVFDTESAVHSTLLEWAQKRGLTPGKAARCILADWSDAMNGHVNPFALAIAAAAGVTGPSVSTTTSSAESALSHEDLARQQALREAAEQFM